MRRVLITQVKISRTFFECIRALVAVRRGGPSLAAIIMGEQPRPTALFAVNDNFAIGALSILLGQGLKVPGDVSLIGYNDIPIVSRLPIPLTTLRVPFDQIATNALNLLSKAEQRRTNPMLVCAPTLIPRQSTGQAPTARS